MNQQGRDVTESMSKGREKGTTDSKQPGKPAGWSLVAYHVASPMGCGIEGGGDEAESGRGMAASNHASTWHGKL